MTERSTDNTCEWDSEKRASNIVKHGIDFDKITEVFNDPFFQYWYDEQNSGIDEDRYKALGEIKAITEVNGIVLFLSYTDIGSIHRIISCRNATPKERGIYYGNIKKING